MLPACFFRPTPKPWNAVRSLTCLSALALLCASSAGAATLDTVRARGHVVCGVSNDVPGFAALDASSQWTGMDIDLCRALAAAIFLDDRKASFRPVEPGEGETALRKGEIDILARPTGQTLDLSVQRGLERAGVSFYDAQVLLVRKSLGIDSALQLSGARVCVGGRPRLREGLRQFFARRKMPLDVREFALDADAAAALESHKCDVLTESQSLIATVTARLKDPGSYAQIAPVLAVQPLGPVVRQGDEAWRRVTEWTLHLMVAAEEAGLDSAEAGKSADARAPAPAQLLKAEAGYGPLLGLSPDWAQAVIAKTGNWGEVFARNLGAGTAVGMERGVNGLWSAGGLMASPGVR